MLTTGPAAEQRRPNEARENLPAQLRAECRALTDAIATTGTRLRIALTADGDPEPFLIHASYHVHSRMHVYAATETEAVMARALESAGTTYRRFLNDAADCGRRLQQPGTPPPVLWDEPAVVITGMAPGTIAEWRRRRLESAEARSESA